jgi:hypothetical protein
MATEQAYQIQTIELGDLRTNVLSGTITARRHDANEPGSDSWSGQLRVENAAELSEGETTVKAVSSGGERLQGMGVVVSILGEIVILQGSGELTIEL